MSYRGIAKGKTIELEEPLPYAYGQPVKVLVEPLEGQPLKGSPAEMLRAVREPPHLSSEDVAALEQAIEEGKLPVCEKGIFDEEST
jgi:hypothetical protein